MTSSTPETNVDAGTLPTERAGEFSLDVEERSIPRRLHAAGSPSCAPATPAPCRRCSAWSSSASSSCRSATGSSPTYNIGNLPGQGAYIAVIAMGLVFVLLLGEIDLSAGTAGGTCAALAAVGVFDGNLHDGLPAFMYWALVVGLLARDRPGRLAQGLAGAVVVARRPRARRHQPDPAPRARPGRRGLHRRRDRRPQRLPGRQGRHPELRGHPGAVPGLAGRAPVRARAASRSTRPTTSSGTTSPTATSAVAQSWIFALVIVVGYLGFTAARARCGPRRAGLAHDVDRAWCCCAAARSPRSASC